MTLFEFLVPVVALAYAGVALLALRVAGRRLDAQLAAERRRAHPAE